MDLGAEGVEVGVGVAAHDDDGQVGVEGADTADEGGTAEPRHREIEEDRGDGGLEGELLEGRFPVGGLGDGRLLKS